MRRAAGAFLLLGLLSACVEEASPTTMAVSSTTSTAVAPSTVTTTTTTVPATTTLPLPPTLVYSIELIGLVPDEPFGGGTALGSGCSPGTEQVPDGVWFGWIEAMGEASIDFDLACFYGVTNPAVQNESARIRELTVHPVAQVFPAGAGAVPYHSWSSSGDPVWLFVNDRRVTEIAVYGSPLSWEYSTTAWPLGMYPGCCDGGTVAPPSPQDPWPDEGWPADGFYEIWVVGYGDGYLDAEITRWHDCDDRPDLCVEWWVGEEVSYDPLEEQLFRRISFDEAVTVVVAPIAQGDDMVLVGEGVAYRDLVSALEDAIELHTEDALDGWLHWEEMAASAKEDPSFPFGPVFYGGEETGYVGYRGPGGAMLSWSAGENWWWHVLEIRDGKPVVYVHAGIIAG